MEITRTFSITETNPLQNIGVWPDMLFPLDVLYSPLLRLRYRSALDYCCNQINVVTGRAVFKAPKEAPNKLAVDLEVKSAPPPTGGIYVRDSDSRKATEGALDVFCDLHGCLVAAVLKLPESENTPYSTLGITLHELGHLLGMSHTDEPDSIMSSNTGYRIQTLSDKDCNALRKLYAKTTILNTEK